MCRCVFNHLYPSMLKHYLPILVAITLIGCNLCSSLACMALLFTVLVCITAGCVHFMSYFYSCHFCVHNCFNLFLINCRLWYKGTLKYLGESVTGSKFGIQNWWCGPCIAVGNTKIGHQGCQWMCRWACAALLHMHSAFPAKKGSRWLWHLVMSQALCLCIEEGAI